MSQINVNTITGKDGGSAVNFPHGIIVTGVVTATSLNQTVNGNITATSFTGPLTGAVTGNVTGNCSGTAGSLAAGATGADFTLSGDLTVNGTTTTIDTAVTAVDSLAVDGSITALGNCGVGTVSPVATDSAYNGGSLHIHQNGNGGSQIRLTNSTASTGAFIAMWSDRDVYITNQEATGDVKFASGGYSDRMTVSQHGMVKFGAPLTEKARYEGVTLNGDYNHDLITHGNVAWLDTAAGGAFALNLRGSATVALNDMMSTGESLSFWFAHACASNTAYYMNALKIDGTTISGTNILWSGGSAPTAAGGGTGTKDVYAFTVFKTANATFRAFASVTNHG